MEQKTAKKYRIISSFILLLAVVAGLAYYRYAHAAAIVWNGAGVDGTCGGAGTANNWTCGANWAGGVAPGGSDIATFNGTSTKNATINAAISVAGIAINSGYTGTITQGGSNTVTVGASNFVQGAGTFTGGSGAIAINGSYSLSAGTYTSTSGTMTVGWINGTTFTVSGGTFNHNNGTVSFAGSVYSNHVVITVPTSFTLYNVQVNLTSYYDSGNLVSISGGPLVVAHDFTLADGTFYSGAWEVQGNVSVGASVDGGAATLSFTGGNAQAFTNSGGTNPTGSVTVNKSGGTVTLASDANWNAASQNLTVTAGTLASSTWSITTNNFTVNGGTFTGGSGTVTTAGPMLVSSGTFTGGAGNVTVNNTFTLSGGTFTSTSGTLQVGRATTPETFFTVSGGTFNHNNGTFKEVESATNCYQTYTLDVPTTLTFYNVIINSSVGGCDPPKITTAAGDTIIAANDFTQTDGQLYGTWEVQGNVIIGSGADGGTGTLTMTGSGAKTYAYSAGGAGPYLRVNNASAVVTSAGGTTDLTVFQFSLLAGSFTAPTGTMTMNYSGGSATTFNVASGSTFSHNNGTVNFSGIPVGCTQTFTADVSTTLTLYNVIISSTAGGCNPTIVAPGAGDTISIAHDFTQTDGILNGSWEMQGNVSIGAGADGGTAPLTFTGPNNQTYTNAGGNEPDGNITINKPAGSVALAGNANWNAASQTLTITQGLLIATGASNLATGALTVAAAGHLRMAGTGILTLGGNVSNAGEISARSTTCGQSDYVQIRSSSTGVQRLWSGAGTFTMQDVDVKDQAGSAAITVYSGTNSLNNGANWTFSGAACPTTLEPALNIGSGLLKIGSGITTFR